MENPMKMKSPASALRNREALNPLMRKGGVHDKSRKTKRHNDKQKFKAMVRQGNFEKMIDRLFPQGYLAIPINLESTAGLAGNQF